MNHHAASRNLKVDHSKFLSVFGSPKRAEILSLLRGHEMSVNRIASSVRLSQSALSQHLAKLKDADLVSTRRDAQTVYYRLDSPAAEAILDVLDKMATGQL